jgi:hypothetical protein
VMRVPLTIAVDAIEWERRWPRELVHAKAKIVHEFFRCSR